jgi:hypothetical protein
MLVCNVSLRPRRIGITAEIAEAAAALDTPGTGNVVFATLVDDPASVLDIVDAYLGEIMLEAASAADTPDASIPTTITAAIVETATATSTQDGSSAPAVPPAFVNVSAVAGNLGQTNGAPTMPGSIVAGNLLIAEVQVFGVNSTISVTGTGWTIGDQAGAGSSCSAWAWRVATGVADGSPPLFSWTGAATFHSKCLQISGNASSPIGAIAHNAAASASTAFTVSGIATTHNASYILGFMSVTGSQVISTPTGFTSRSQFNDSFGSDRLCDETVSSSGSTSDNLNATLSPGADWQGFLIEVKSP